MATKFGWSFSCTLDIINTKRSLCKYESSTWQITRAQAPSSSLCVRAAAGPNSPGPTSPLQDDLTYVLKLAGGSILGAALIKYGSASIPDITRPNLTLALLMISTPVVVAVLLLLVRSRKE